MSPDDLERRLTEAFGEQARRAVDDQAPIPPMQVDRPAQHRPRRPISKVLAPLAAAAAIAAVAVGIAVHQDNHASRPSAVGPVTSHSASITSAASTRPTLAAQPVHVSLQNSDGAQVGVGMPIIAYLSRPIADAQAFNAATRVTVDGKPVSGAWYFEYKTGLPGKPIEADWRMATYWPGHARIHMDLPVKGLSAGSGLSYNDDLSLDFSTGPANIVTVDDKSHVMTVVSDGVKWGSFPVSLGAPTTPTLHGIKVIMEKGANICMTGPGYSECGIKYTQRLTYGGEYLHAAPWNTKHIAAGIDSSNGCTNLTIADAEKLYGLLEIGDVVNYPDANGRHMTMSDGYGDWNVSWATWLTGGLFRTR